MAKGINVEITAGSGGTPVTYAVSRNIASAGWTVIEAALAYTASPQVYADQGNFADNVSVQYRATATNVDGTSTEAAVQTLVVSGSSGKNVLDFGDGTNSRFISLNANKVISGDFVVKFWIKPIAESNSFIPVLGHGTNNRLLLSNTGGALLRVNGVSGSIGGALGITMGDWNLITLTRVGAAVTLDVNGTDLGNFGATLSGDFTISRVGADETTGNRFINGLIANFDLNGESYLLPEGSGLTTSSNASPTPSTAALSTGTLWDNEATNPLAL